MKRCRPAASGDDFGRGGGWRLFLLLAALAVAVYANALGNPFHFDDLHSIEHNPHIRSIANLPDFFADPQTFSSERQGMMFRPLLLTTYALNWEVGDDNPAGFRWVNIALHALLAHRVCHQITGDAMVGLLAALIMVLHPLHSELINYISSRSDLLVAVLVMAAFAFAAGESGLSMSRPTAFVAFAAGLLSKSVAVTAPVLIADHVLWARGWQGLRKRSRGYLALAAITGAYLVTIVLNRFVASSVAKAPRGFGDQAWTQVKGYVCYLWKFTMPVNLAVRWWRSPVALGLVWFAVTLSPASLFPLNLLVVERRIYLAAFGLALIAAWALAGAGSLLVLGLIFAVLVLQRNGDWSTRTGLWERTVAASPEMPRPRFNLALAYAKEERHAEALVHLETALRLQPNFAGAWAELGNIRKELGDLAAAEQAYRQALEFSPSLEGVYYNLGNVYQAAGRHAEAVAQYRETLSRDPEFADAHNNLGQAFEQMGRADSARFQYRRAGPHAGLVQLGCNSRARREGRRGRHRVHARPRPSGRASRLCREFDVPGVCRQGTSGAGPAAGQRIVTCDILGRREG